ncbi:ABC transporter substrate-binding protein [Corynebacterium epidermidicanis]|uniref:ABC-type Fe3+ transport system, periplasmic component n=1 Tax=Corynebacterium epidermidicanis TaxID=1050174 RepID=A0A0G3GT41_9CORY|nr:ABC transporter substrate-binding protein [Corynebacterium epidermidicanis]AKK03705.1 ABC-type Fe3+ transport system, periplasmic component [Corynebacterium epidermidicanis]
MLSKDLLKPAVAVVAAATLLGACAEPSQPSENSTNKAGEKTKITVYTSEPEAKVDEINKAFKEKNPNIDVEVFRGGTGDLNARIESEKKTGNVGADILWAADAPTFETYAEAGDLLKLDKLDVSKVKEEAKDPEGFYVGTRFIPTVIAYNSQQITDKPQSWQDLTDPKYLDKLVLPDPAVSGAAAFNASAWKNDPQLGEEWIKKLGANKPMIAKSNGPASQEIASGSRPVGIVVDYLVRDLAAKGSPIAVAYPAEGAPYITEPAGIFKGSKNQEAATKYLEFLLSKEGQELAVKQNYLPVREDAGSPKDAPALKDIKLMDQDLKKITADKKAATATFQEAIK